MTPKRGRRPGPTQSREQILRVAREQFAARGYDRTTVRSIADAAGVHRALLHHYFKTKQDLYSQALDMPIDLWAAIDRLINDTPREMLPEALTRHFITTWRDPIIGPSLQARARHNLGDPVGPNMAKVHLETVAIPRFAHALGIPELNMGAALAHLIGLTWTDTLLDVRQIANASIDELVALVSPVIAHYLTPRNAD